MIACAVHAALESCPHTNTNPKRERGTLGCCSRLVTRGQNVPRSRFGLVCPRPSVLRFAAILRHPRIILFPARDRQMTQRNADWKGEERSRRRARGRARAGPEPAACKREETNRDCAPPDPWVGPGRFLKSFCRCGPNRAHPDARRTRSAFANSPCPRPHWRSDESAAVGPAERNSAGPDRGLSVAVHSPDKRGGWC